MRKSPRSVIDQIESLHRAETFRPFVIVLDDGRRITISRPEFLGEFPKRDRLFYSTPADTTEVVEVSRVARVEPVNGPGGPGVKGE